MMRIDFKHFWPRYGIAVAIHRANSSSETTGEQRDRDLAEMLAHAIEHELGRVMLFTRNNPEHEEELSFEPLSRDILAPGKEVDGKKQNADNGFYLAPHVATSNNAAPVVDEPVANSRYGPKNHWMAMHGP
jgi:hypothetical protein